jgi:septum formation topological specificity factor MinE
MPAPNDLTPEEEEAFVQHGVQPAGPGGEPVIDTEEPQQQAPAEGEQVGDQQPQHGDRATDAAAQISRHRADGTFKTKEELDAEIAALPQQAAEGEQGQQQEPKMVPHQALHAERLRSSEAIRTAQLATARLNAILSQQRQTGEVPEALPDLNEDPVGYITALEKRLARFENERAEEAQYRQLDNALEQDEELFKQRAPDYELASDYFVQSRARELLQFHTPEDARAILTQEARAIAQQSWQRGTSAAQTVYQLAQARGYNPQNTAANPTKHPIQEQQGQQVQQQTNGSGGPTAQATVAAITAGQAASRSLSGGAGAASTGTLNADAILNMSDEEFEDYLQIGTKGANERFAAIG